MCELCTHLQTQCSVNGVWIQIWSFWWRVSVIIAAGWKKVLLTAPVSLSFLHANIRLMEIIPGYVLPTVVHPVSSSFFPWLSLNIHKPASLLRKGSLELPDTVSSCSWSLKHIDYSKTITKHPNIRVYSVEESAVCLASPLTALEVTC